MRIVLKIGSSSLTQGEGGLDRGKLGAHVTAAAKLVEAGHEVVIVSSGAVASGFPRLGYPGRPKTLTGKQAAAAVGQSVLMRAYSDAFEPRGIVVGQVLLTRRDFLDRRAFENAHTTLEELVERRAVPIINENDTVATQELRFGDNDVLSALVAGMVQADFLVILTDVDGLYTADPRREPGATRIRELDSIDTELLSAAGGPGSSVGTGGMRSKLLAAHRALSLGVPVFIGYSSDKEDFGEIVDRRGAGTYIGGALQSGLGRKKQWIAFHASSAGRIFIDAGACEALLTGGRSLLPVGVTGADGEFKAEEIVEVHRNTGGESTLIGRGIVEFGRQELESIRGKSSQETRVLTRRAHDEVVHRNNFVSLRDLIEEEAS